MKYEQEKVKKYLVHSMLPLTAKLMYLSKHVVAYSTTCNVIDVMWSF